MDFGDILNILCERGVPADRIHYWLLTRNAENPMSSTLIYARIRKLVGAPDDVPNNTLLHKYPHWWKQDPTITREEWSPRDMVLYDKYVNYVNQPWKQYDAVCPDQECGICLNDLSDVALEECGHMMCKKCYRVIASDTYLNVPIKLYKFDCPYCKKEIYGEGDRNRESNILQIQPASLVWVYSNISETGSPNAGSIGRVTQLTHNYVWVKTYHDNKTRAYRPKRVFDIGFFELNLLVPRSEVHERADLIVAMDEQSVNREFAPMVTMSIPSLTISARQLALGFYKIDNPNRVQISSFISDQLAAAETLLGVETRDELIGLIRTHRVYTESPLVATLARDNNMKRMTPEDLADKIIQSIRLRFIDNPRVNVPEGILTFPPMPHHNDMTCSSCRVQESVDASTRRAFPRHPFDCVL